MYNTIDTLATSENLALDSETTTLVKSFECSSSNLHNLCITINENKGGEIIASLTSILVLGYWDKLLEVYEIAINEFKAINFGKREQKSIAIEEGKAKEAKLILNLHSAFLELNRLDNSSEGSNNSAPLPLYYKNKQVYLIFKDAMLEIALSGDPAMHTISKIVTVNEKKDHYYKVISNIISISLSQSSICVGSPSNDFRLSGSNSLLPSDLRMLVGNLSGKVNMMKYVGNKQKESEMSAPVGKGFTICVDQGNLYLDEYSIIWMQQQILSQINEIMKMISKITNSKDRSDEKVDIKKSDEEWINSIPFKAELEPQKIISDLYHNTIIDGELSKSAFIADAFQILLRHVTLYYFLEQECYEKYRKQLNLLEFLKEETEPKRDDRLEETLPANSLKATLTDFRYCSNIVLLHSKSEMKSASPLAKNSITIINLRSFLLEIAPDTEKACPQCILTSKATSNAKKLFMQIEFYPWKKIIQIKSPIFWCNPSTIQRILIIKPKIELLMNYFIGKSRASSEEAKEIPSSHSLPLTPPTEISLQLQKFSLFVACNKSITPKPNSSTVQIIHPEHDSSPLAGTAIQLIFTLVTTISPQILTANITNLAINYFTDNKVSESGSFSLQQNLSQFSSKKFLPKMTILYPVTMNGVISEKPIESSEEDDNFPRIRKAKVIECVINQMEFEASIPVLFNIQELIMSLRIEDVLQSLSSSSVEYQKKEERLEHPNNQQPLNVVIGIYNLYGILLMESSQQKKALLPIASFESNKISINFKSMASRGFALKSKSHLSFWILNYNSTLFEPLIEQTKLEFVISSDEKASCRAEMNIPEILNINYSIGMFETISELIKSYFSFIAAKQKGEICSIVGGELNPSGHSVYRIKNCTGDDIICRTINQKEDTQVKIKKAREEIIERKESEESKELPSQPKRFSSVDMGEASVNFPGGGSTEERMQILSPYSRKNFKSSFGYSAPKNTAFSV